MLGPVARLEWLARVATSPAITRAAVAVAGVLATFKTAPGGVIYPSVETISARAGITRRGAQKAIAQLVVAGLLSLERGGGRSHTTVYSLVETVNGGSPIAPPEKANGHSLYSGETANGKVQNGELRGRKTANGCSPELGSNSIKSPDERPGVTVSKWDRRIGAYAKSSDERKAMLTMISNYGGNDADVAKALASIPSAPSDKAAARVLIESALLPLIDRLREAHESAEAEKRMAARQAERKAKAEAEQAKRDAEARRKAEEAAKPGNIFFEKVFHSELWKSNSRPEGQRELNDVLMGIKDELDRGNVSLDLAMQKADMALCLPTIMERIAVFKEIALTVPHAA